MGLGSVAAERGDPRGCRPRRACHPDVRGRGIGGAAHRDAADRGDGVLAGGRDGQVPRVRRAGRTAAGSGTADRAGWCCSPRPRAWRSPRVTSTAAVRSGLAADAEATELGVDRELPLLRCLLALRPARAWRPRRRLGDRPRAPSTPRCALGYDYPLAGALEAVAAVGRERGMPAEDLGILVASASQIREPRRPTGAGPAGPAGAATCGRAAGAAATGAPEAPNWPATCSRPHRTRARAQGRRCGRRWW